MSGANRSRSVPGDPGLPFDVREAIRIANEEDAKPESVARLAARLAPIVGASLVSGTIAPDAALQGVGSVSAKVVVAKITAGVVAVAATGAAAVAYVRSTPPEPAAPRATTSVIVAPAAASAPVPAVEARPDSGQHGAHIHPETATPAPRLDKSTPSPAPAPSADRLAEEARLLRQARAVLAENPAAALEITRRHAERFRQGSLAHEREVLAIQALIGLGRRDDARRRLDAFRRAFPKSPQGDRFEKMLLAP
jgi:hypothetical protein